MNRYHGRVVAITGGAQGLGLAMAARFAAEGAAVALADVNGQALADAAEAIPHDAELRTDVVDVTAHPAPDGRVLWAELPIYGRTAPRVHKRPPRLGASTRTPGSGRP